MTDKFVKIHYSCLKHKELAQKHQIQLFWCLLISMRDKDGQVYFNVKQFSELLGVSEKMVRRMKNILIIKNLIEKRERGKYLVRGGRGTQFFKMPLSELKDKTLTVSEKIVKYYLQDFYKHFEEIKIKTIADNLGMHPERVRHIIKKLNNNSTKRNTYALSPENTYVINEAKRGYGKTC